MLSWWWDWLLTTRPRHLDIDLLLLRCGWGLFGDGLGPLEDEGEDGQAEGRVGLEEGAHGPVAPAVAHPDDHQRPVRV